MSLITNKRILLPVCIILLLGLIFLLVKQENTSAGAGTSTYTMNAPDGKVSTIESKLKIDLTKSQIISTLSDKYREVKDLGTNTPQWRYDISESNGELTFRGDFVEHLNGDYVDVEALKDKRLDMQIFITFNQEDKVDEFTVYYKKQDDKVYRKTVGREKTEEYEVE